MRTREEKGMGVR